MFLGLGTLILLAVKEGEYYYLPEIARCILHDQFGLYILPK